MTSGEVIIKTASRVPLASRLPRKKVVNTPFPNALHNAQETIYDISYTGAQGDNCSASKRFGRSQLTDSARGSTTDGGTGGAVESGGDDGRCAVQTTGIKSEGRDKRFPNRVISAFPTAHWESEAHAATRVVQPEQQLDFYSNVRKIEQVDDNLRGGPVTGTQRSVEIRTKRGFDSSMQPQNHVYCSAEPVEMPLVAAQEKRLVRRNYLDLVECTHLDPDTEEQIGFDKYPVNRLPGLDLSQEYPVQSKVITKMGTSHELFRGYSKYVDDKTIGYAGHIPMSDRALEAIHGGVDARREFAKSYMTLAVHGGGVDASSAIRRRHPGGRYARAPQMLKPKNDETICKTTEGYMLQRTYQQTLERERAMNIRDDKRGKSYF